jgi:MATE family multidrug resistance protein
MLRLAAPLALAELAWIAMGFVDTIMAGRLGAAAVGAGSVGSVLFFLVAVSGAGMFYGVDTLAAQAFGAKDLDECREVLVDALWLAFAMAPLVAGALWALLPVVRAAGANSAVTALLDPFVKALLPGVLPLLCYAALRRYLQAINIAGPITFAAITANLINLAGDWALMFGHWGAPTLGLTGSGWSTSLARFYIAAVLLAAVLWNERRSGRHALRFRPPDLRRIGALVHLGVHSALQIVVEGGIFAVATVLAAKLDAVSLAAHSIALNVVTFTYMVPVGISNAAAVRVGHAVGRRDPRGAALSGWTALLLGALSMGAAALILFFAPRWVVRLYTPEPAILTAGASLLQIAAMFQLFDGFQVVALGALRGLGDTRTPMLAHLAGYWIFGMPVSYALCFAYGWGARGIWAGLCLALILIGASLLVVWSRSSRRAPSLRTSGE